MTWPLVPLSEVCKCQTGTRDPRSEPARLFTYVDIGSVDNKQKRISEPKPLPGADAPSRARRLIKTNDVIVSMTRPNLNAVAMVPDSLDSQICSTGFAVLRANGKVLPEYLFHFTTSARFIRIAGGAVSGAMYPAITERFLRSIEIPLPPLDEQRRIVDILNRANGVVRLRREALDKTRQLIPALFVDMFGDPATNPRGWPEVRLGSVTGFVAGSSLPEGVEFAGQPAGTLLLKVSDLNHPLNQKFVNTARLWTPNRIRGQLFCEAEAVIFPKRGAAIATNKKRLLIRDAALDPNLMGVRPDPSRLDSLYLLSWFDAFDLASIQSGSTVPQLNKRDLAPLTIPVPPKPRQDAFASRVADIQATIVQQERMAEASEQLVAALMARLFDGAPAKPDTLAAPA